jgi:hypothetical protein
MIWRAKPHYKITDLAFEISELTVETLRSVRVDEVDKLLASWQGEQFSYFS